MIHVPATQARSIRIVVVNSRFYKSLRGFDNLKKYKLTIKIENFPRFLKMREIIFKARGANENKLFR